MMLQAKLQGPIRVTTPAKITPYLHVLGRSDDRHHEVRLALVPVSLFDELTFRPEATGKTSFAVESPQLLGAPEDNLVLRAARAFHAVVDDAPAVAIHLMKRIPAGAGLGGGSGNAAGTLVTLNRLAGTPLSRGRLLEIAAGLGADVPFFIDPRPCRAEGRGERLQGQEGFPALPLIVIMPGFSVATAEAYREVRPKPRDTPPPRLSSLEEVLTALENDFERSLFPRYPLLAEIKARLVTEGAAGALLSGSGSAVFGLFADAETRDRALATLVADPRWQCLPCEVLERHQYLAADLRG